MQATELLHAWRPRAEAPGQAPAAEHIAVSFDTPVFPLQVRGPKEGVSGVDPPWRAPCLGVLAPCFGVLARRQSMATSRSGCSVAVQVFNISCPCWLLTQVRIRLVYGHGAITGVQLISVDGAHTRLPWLGDSMWLGDCGAWETW